MAQLNTYTLNSAATTNGALISPGGTKLKSFITSNAGAAAAFVKLYNRSTAPVVGTTVPVIVIPIPASSVISLAIGADGIQFPSGLGIAVTNLVDDTDTTAVAASQVKVLANFETS
jgi:hypothetical protein